MFIFNCNLGRRLADPTVLETLGVNFRRAAGPLGPATPMPRDKFLSPKLWLFASYLGGLSPHFVQIFASKKVEIE